jgi:cyclophilin family peptidyl-prolyl cis-trans isomerase
MTLKKLLISIAALALTLNIQLAQAANPKVKLETSKGTMIIELYPDKAPKTVENFLAYVNAGAYDGTIFHRVIKDFMNQGGGFTPDFKKVDTRQPIQNEADNGLKNLKYTVAMARTGEPHSATNQFFINTADNAFLDHKSKSMRGWGYTVFGKVIEGENIAGAISRVPTGPGGPFSKDVPRTQVTIIKMTEIKE